MSYIVVTHEVFEDSHVINAYTTEDEALAKTTALRVNNRETQRAKDNGGYPGSALIFDTSHMNSLADVVAELDAAEAAVDFQPGDEIEYLKQAKFNGQDVWAPGIVLQVGRQVGNRFDNDILWIDREETAPIDPGRAWMRRWRVRWPHAQANAA